jgi:hypothetical protein
MIKQSSPAESVITLSNMAELLQMTALKTILLAAIWLSLPRGECLSRPVDPDGHYPGKGLLMTEASVETRPSSMRRAENTATLPSGEGEAKGNSKQERSGTPPERDQKKEGVFVPFTPTEKVKADQAVDFPWDI